MMMIVIIMQLKNRGNYKLTTVWHSLQLSSSLIVACSWMFSVLHLEIYTLHTVSCYSN